MDILDVEADSVVFNFECCSNFSDSGFGSGNVMGIIEELIMSGHMVMCSDFSLKALISCWNRQTAPRLGPNPFKKLGEFSESHVLVFDPEVLAKCCSTQLQKVGDLCKDGKCVVKALSGTIVYAADKALADNSDYKLEVLTVVTRTSSFNVASAASNFTWSVKDTKGVCGHTVLTYPGGGKLLTSCGHWIELAKLDVSEEALLRVARKEYGEAYAQELQSSLEKTSDAASRKECVEKSAAKMVWSSAPQEYSKGWGKSKANYKW